MKKCIKCGKNFSNDDKRVKKCDACRFGSEEEQKKQELEKMLREQTDRMQFALKRIRRKTLIKKVVTISILVLVEIVNIVLIFTK